MNRSPAQPLDRLSRRIVSCDACPRLREHCELVAKTKKRAYIDWDYWGKPVPGFGDPSARLWVLGLAPGAHGANRTGRVFTGDESGNFLYAALHRAGFANQPTSRSRDDGLKLTDCYISAAARCAPPGNKPTPGELASCEPFLDDEWKLLVRKRVLLALGGIAWMAAQRLAVRMSDSTADTSPHRGSRRPFGHGASITFASGLTLIGSYHVSQQNTFTGRLTPAMLDDILRQVRGRL
jgi:uracil-DNA glycosylase